MVTDLVRAALLEDGLPSVSRGNVSIMLPISYLVRSITLLAVAVG